MINSTRYIIMKSSRSPSQEKARATDAYGGPSCAKVNIPEYHTYNNLETAVRDALTLKSVNPVGFRIWQIGNTKPELSTEGTDQFNGNPVPQIQS